MGQFGGDPDTIKKWLVFPLEIAARMMSAQSEAMSGGSDKPSPLSKPTGEDMAIIAMLEAKERRLNGTDA